MAYDNDAAKAELVRTLRISRQAILLVGSGISLTVGYPSWPRLLDQLQQQIIPESPFPAGLEDLLQRASFVRTTLEGFPNAVDRRRQYRDYFEHNFGPRNPNFAPLHRTLIQLPVCGIVTTNYDPVLESAITSVRVAAGLSACTSIDACANHRHRVFRFLRGLSSDGDIASVLHLHGFWEHPEGIILTSENYAERYGLRASADPAAGDPLTAPARPLDTFHRKVVWSLLTTRPVMFVGFSVEDPAFQLMLSFVHDDFDLAPNPAAHFAVLPSDPEDGEQRDRDAARLAGFGVHPVFYDITVDDAGNRSHGRLVELIEELAGSIGTPTTPGISGLSRRMLAR